MGFLDFYLRSVAVPGTSFDSPMRITVEGWRIIFGVELK